MKKIVTILAFLLSTILVNAQNEKSYGPVAGNYAVGISTRPLFEYFGNLFSNETGNSAPTFNLPKHSLAGKYFIEDDRAIRAGISFGSGNRNFNNIDNVNSNNYELTQKNLSLGIGVGLEFRKGIDKIQAFYGPSIGFSYSDNKTEISYPDDDTPRNIAYDYFSNEFAFNLGGFAGIEYFISKNIALGTELGFGLKIDSNEHQRKSVENKEIFNENKTSSINIGFLEMNAQLAPRGTLFFMFYF